MHHAKRKRHLSIMVLTHFFNLYGNPTLAVIQATKGKKKKSSSKKYEKRKHQKPML